MSKVDVRELSCGVKVVFEPIDYVQSVAFGLWVKAGAVNEDEKIAGISHYIEHMMFKGTEKRSARMIAEDIDRIGGQINAFTGKEATCYYVKTVETNIKKGAEVILDMINNSVFDKEEMKKERMVICEEIKMIQDQPDDLAHDKCIELLFKDSPLGKSIIGTASSLKSISQGTILNYKKKHYTCDNIVVSIAGKFDEDDIISFLEDKFDKLEKNGEKCQFTYGEYKPAKKVITRDIQQSHLCMATKALPNGHEDYQALSILNNIMGGTMSSRLFQNIREDKGLAYSVYSMISGYSNEGYYNIYAGVSHDKIRDAVLGIEEELLQLKKEGVTEDELKMSKEQIKSNYIFGMENVAARMFANGKSMLLQEKIYYPEDIIDEVDKVTMEKIENVKDIICNLENYTCVGVTKNRFDWKNIWKW